MVLFHQQIISELLEDPNGGLVVLSSGLSLAKLISSLLLFHDRSQGTLLFLTPPAPLKSLILQDPNLPPDFISEVTAELPSHQRLSIYTSGSICFVTPRILIVDVLTGKVPVSSISGIILPSAHMLSETSTEAFIARVLKSQTLIRPSSSPLFVRAFTDKPHAMVSGFAKTERIMKALHIRKLHLWPRFQVQVSQELEQHQPEVIDVRVPMSKHMVEIQKAILEVMDVCLKEMRKTNKVDVEDLTIENGLFKSFDEIVKRQLDPIWHSLGKRTKQLVSDLRTLRKLLEYLVRYDAVSFLKYLDTLRVSESSRSVWIFAESSYKIFEHSKKRVYQLAKEGNVITTKKRKKPNDNASKEGVCIVKNIEKSPKWKVLKEILDEIKEEKEKSDENEDGLVVVACKDERSCMQLQECIQSSPEKVLESEWEMYLLSKVELRGLESTEGKKGKKKRESKGVGVLDGAVHVTLQTPEFFTANKQENDAVLAAASEIRARLKASPENGDEQHVSDESGNLFFYPLESNQPILDVLTPSVIIVYNPEISFVREIEVYKAENPTKRIKVYFLFYDESTEVRKYESSIRRENEAFEALIRQKSLMMIPIDHNDQSKEHESSIPRTIFKKEKEMQVIVDMREFMSSLPNVLHQKGMKIIPVTLEVGDYILSPLICVERKSIQDLYSSFTSGRLFNQAETMVRYYKIPVLLIEFSQDKSFSFLSSGDLGDDLTPNSIISKLSLLALHFPRLRVIWSRSLHATAEIFATLKANQDEPDESKATRVGVPSEDGVVQNDVRAENYNTSAVELLRRLPGVTDGNYRALMECNSLSELALMPVDKLAPLMGGLKSAQCLRDFLDAKYPTLL